MCRIFFKKVDYISCKIIAFEEKKKALFLHLAKQGQQILYTLGLELLHYTKLRFLILLNKKSIKQLKSKKNKILFFKKSLSERCIRKN
jgi:hypothetical protein